MNNPFKNIIHQEKLPEAIKEKVMDDVQSIKLVLDMADLTLIKYPSLVENLFQNISKNKNQ